MLRQSAILLTISFVLLSCGSNSNQKEAPGSKVESHFKSTAHQGFIEHLSQYCGKSFSGFEYFRSPHGESWAYKKLSIHFTSCRPGEVQIALYVDQDSSRTWIFTAENKQLKLMHQHLDASGELEPGSMYGGLANEKGSAQIQYFPADEFTARVIDGAANNTWIVSLGEENAWLSYRLDRDEEPRFEYRFDLTKEL